MSETAAIVGLFLVLVSSDPGALASSPEGWALMAIPVLIALNVFAVIGWALWSVGGVVVGLWRRLRLSR